MIAFSKGNQFFLKIEEAARNILSASQLLADFIDAGELTEAHLRQLEDKEHEGDRITQDTVQMLNKTFITPIDREDIHELISRLDDVLDFIYGVAKRMVLYRIGRPDEAFRSLARILLRTVEEVTEAVLRLKEIKNVEMILAQCLQISRLESEADNSHRRAVADLFDNEKDPIRIMKVKEILDQMEDATDVCEDVADVIKGIVVKNA